jgi:hypothetical protein
LGQKRLMPATAARGFLPLAALSRRHSSRDKKAVLAVLRWRCGPAG